MRFLLRHKTTYRYANPVTLRRHRLMIRPRDSHEMKLHEATLGLTPPGAVLWQYDVFGNSVALVDFAEPATELAIDSTLDVERFPAHSQHVVAEHARTLPLAYSPRRSATSPACRNAMCPILITSSTSGPRASW